MQLIEDMILIGDYVVKSPLEVVLVRVDLHVIEISSEVDTEIVGEIEVILRNAKGYIPVGRVRQMEGYMEVACNIYSSFFRKKLGNFNLPIVAK